MTVKTTPSAMLAVLKQPGVNWSAMRPVVDVVLGGQGGPVADKLVMEETVIIGNPGGKDSGGAGESNDTGGLGESSQETEDDEYGECPGGEDEDSPGGGESSGGGESEQGGAGGGEPLT